jgi:probable rRNA maturation factor
MKEPLKYSHNIDYSSQLVSYFIKTMNYYIDIQNVTDTSLPVSDEVLTEWASLTIRSFMPSAELTLRFVDSQTITELNTTYRKQNKATNVLAFPSFLPKDIILDEPLLGDIIICPEVLDDESKLLNKPLISHWAHIVIHGILHLLGYDHIKPEDEKIMQLHEITLLAKLGYANPYNTEDLDLEQT